jgi:serine/threonine protein kinase
MAKVIAIGQPVNDAEHRAIAFLRDNLPNTYTIIHSFEIRRHHEKQSYEIDIALIAPHSLFLIDVKGTLGHIDLYSHQWQPRGRQPYTSPLPKLRQNAKILKSFIKDQFPTQRVFDKLYTHAVILLTDPKATIQDFSGKAESDDITFLDHRCLTYFKGKAHIPSHFISDIRTLEASIITAIQGKAPAKSPLPRFRDWQVEEKLGTKLVQDETGDHDIQAIEYIDYRAKHILFGQRNIARLRVYHVDPHKDLEQRERDKVQISNAYSTLGNLSPHSNILALREFFDTEEGDRYILVTEDTPGNTLHQHLHNPDLSLTFDQKIITIQDTLEGLNHAHKGTVTHRNLTPEAILIGLDGKTRLTNFDYARIGDSRSQTIAEYAANKVNYDYQAPETYGDPSQASVASDLFSAGLIFYEILTGKRPFASIKEIDEMEAIFPIAASQHQPDLPPAIDVWLQKLCAYDKEDRQVSAKLALHELNRILLPVVSPTSPAPVASEQKPLTDLRNLPKDYTINNQFVVEEPLGSGGFGTTYKVFDSIGGISRVMKLIDRDRRSVFDRLRQEYEKLTKLNHPNIVQVLIGGRFPDDTPYLIFPYIEGSTVEKLIIDSSLTLEDTIQVIHQTAAGLAYVHENGIYHQDIKPDNLYWTADGIRILDFNVSVSDQDTNFKVGGTDRYIPPDFDTAQKPTSIEMIDRDLYALGITFYECLTSKHPFDGKKPPNKPAPDPRTISGCNELSAELAALVQKAIAPRRSQRFRTAKEFQNAIDKIKHLRHVTPSLEPTKESSSSSSFIPITSHKANFNPFVSYLLTLHSQSQQSNAGTRGLDEHSKRTYIDTLLDTALLPAILQGEFKLILISGNAGDGKTAFIQKLEDQIEPSAIKRHLNGSTFTHNKRTFRTNYDGSQDEGNKTNKAVLLDFLAPFQGAEPSAWNTNEIHIIAINEGRLVDFLSEHQSQYSYLYQLVQQGLRGGPVADGISIINLNLRSVVADTNGELSSIFDRFIRRLAKPEFWQPCQTCDIKDRCYVHHNARTLISDKSSSKVIERLKTLYELTHLRGRLHITLRDLRSALAFTLAGTRNCDQIHELYQHGTPESRLEILNGFYFNAWIGGEMGSKDRLLSLLSEIDIGETSNPQRDRSFSFLEPDQRSAERFTFNDRPQYDTDLLQKLFADLPRDYSSKISQVDIQTHRTYVAMLRRRYYFERRDNEWKTMLPFRSELQFLRLIKGEAALEPEVQSLITAINRGEGLRDTNNLGDSLALRVRQVDRGTLHSYRLFDLSAFSLHLTTFANQPFLEFLPQSIRLRYDGPANIAELIINLDIYEMLAKLKQGYYPNLEEQQGIYRSLAVFKNILAAAPYQEVLLTETGREFHSVRRDEQGNLLMTKRGATT